MSRKKVIHVVPKNVIGGVEVAARGVVKNFPHNLDFKLLFIGDWGNLKNPRSHFKCLSHIFKTSPDILICSLWWCSFVGMAYKLLKPSKKVVLFLHSEKSEHLFDYVMTRLMFVFSCEVWCDSEKTKKTFEKWNVFKKKFKVISFVLNRRDPCSFSNLSPSFVFWGRLANSKGIDRALNLFWKIKEQFPDANFRLYGPDGGEKKKLVELSNDLKLHDSVIFSDEICHSRLQEVAYNQCFFLLLSHYEGMAMSVVEAMQLGSVPIVTPVGQIGEYCDHMRNAIIYSNDENVLSDLKLVLSNVSLYIEMRNAAIDRWKSVRTYNEDLFMCIDQID